MDSICYFTPSLALIGESITDSKETLSCVASTPYHFACWILSSFTSALFHGPKLILGYYSYCFFCFKRSKCTLVISYEFLSRLLYARYCCVLRNPRWFQHIHTYVSCDVSNSYTRLGTKTCWWRTDYRIFLALPKLTTPKHPRWSSVNVSILMPRSTSCLWSWMRTSVQQNYDLHRIMSAVDKI